MPKSTIGENPLIFPVPDRDGLGSITVLCGPNGSGKSYILRMLKNLLEKKGASQFNTGHGWKVEFAADDTVASHRPHHHTVQMTSIGSFSVGRAGKAIANNDLDLQVQVTLFGLLIDALGHPSTFDHAKWAMDPDYRASVIGALGPEDEELVYWLKQDAPAFVRLFEDIFGCRLGMRRPKNSVELVLGWPNGVTAPFASWSDGQKSFFTVLAVTLALKPDVYIFDEVENFLHPELISRMLDHLKRNCRQTVLSSHHPHLIFGRAVDAVYYVETVNPDRPLFADRTVKYQKQPSAPRRITRLENDRAKLASAYRLFDVRDAALLASAAHVRSAVDLHLHDAVRGLYECGAAPANAGVYMDRQSEEIASFIASFAPAPRRIVDWGAGLGRSLTELSKRIPIDADAKLSWTLYEPNSATRSALVATRTPDDIAVGIVGDRTTLSKVEAGLVLLTNVLHVLDLNGWRDALGDACDVAMSAENGVILVTEIYPLLVPEKSAIPVPPEWLASLFRALGFRTMVRNFAIQGSTSYCLAASQPPKTRPTDEALLDLVVEHWRGLSLYYLHIYEGVGMVQSLSDQKDLLNAAFGLARVTSCLNAIDIGKPAG